MNYGKLEIYLSNEKEQEYFDLKIKNIFLADEVDEKITKLLALRKDCYENKLDSLSAIDKEIRLARIAEAIKDFGDISEKNSKEIFFMK